MNGTVLPAAIFCACAYAGAALAEEPLTLPGLGDGAAAPEALPACTEDRFGPQNCVRFFACVGEEGLWLDGQAWGWNTGKILAVRNDGVACAGQWTADGPLGFGLAEASCQDGTTIEAVYTTRDEETGTVIGTGRDSAGRNIRAWSGLYVLDFLRGGDGVPELPCGPTSIPIS
jgi:hypothetical protein